MTIYINEDPLGNRATQITEQIHRQVGKPDLRFTPTVPAKLSEALADFAEKLGATEAPSFAPIIPNDFGILSKCWSNADIATDIHPNSTAWTGYLLWELRGFYLYADLHSLVKTETGFVDYTPQPEGVQKVLFAPLCPSPLDSERALHKITELNAQFPPAHYRLSNCSDRLWQLLKESRAFSQEFHKRTDKSIATGCPLAFPDGFKANMNNICNEITNIRENGTIHEIRQKRREHRQAKKRERQRRGR